MMINTENIVTITEANRNFSAVAKVVDQRGEVVVFKNNRPTYFIYPMEERPMDLTDEERFEVAAKRVLKRHIGAFKELAK